MFIGNLFKRGHSFGISGNLWQSIPEGTTIVGKRFHAKPLDLGNTKPLAILQDCI